MSVPPLLFEGNTFWGQRDALDEAEPGENARALRVAHNCGSKFEWDEHSDYARDAGLTDAEIAAVARPIDEGAWSASERALLQAADDLHATQNVADETWAVLASYYDTPALAEILFVVGQYTMLSMVANAAGIDG